MFTKNTTPNAETTEQYSALNLDTTISFVGLKFIWSDFGEKEPVHLIRASYRVGNDMAS